MHAELLDSALKLACAGSSGPASQADLRRALSTAYYAAFHFVVAECADLLANDRGGSDLERAWLQVYRSINHADVRTACNYAASADNAFPSSIRSFAVLYPSLKRIREDADYNPRIGASINENYVLAKIGEADVALADFAAEDRRHRQAFAVLVAYGGRKRNH